MRTIKQTGLLHSVRNESKRCAGYGKDEARCGIANLRHIVPNFPSRCIYIPLKIITNQIIAAVDTAYGGLVHAGGDFIIYVSAIAA